VVDDRPPARGRLRHDSVPMRLYHDAKQSVWDPRLCDFSQDAKDFARLTVVERDALVRLSAMFLAAEEGMTRDLLPLLITVAREDRLEEELFLATFLADEAKHIEFFRRELEEVCGQSGDLLRYQTPSFRKLFAEKLPTTMQTLLADRTAIMQAEAMVTYSLVGEGVLGEAGYHVYATALDRRGLMPGFREGLRHAQADEERHMAYGLFLLSRLLEEDANVWEAIRGTMDDLIPDTLGIVTEFYDSYDPIPFGLSLKDTVEYAMEKFAGRWESLEGAWERIKAGARVSPEDDAVRQVLGWVRERAHPAPVEVQRDEAASIYAFRVGPAGGSTLLISQEVLANHSSGEIIAVLGEYHVPERWRERTGRLMCLRARGKIVVQAPAV
jgi:ribonucleoside-diphosphate reductase beta chain